MNSTEQVLVNRAATGKYLKSDLINITNKLWINGEITEAVKDQVMAIIEGRTDCEPDPTPQQLMQYQIDDITKRQDIAEQALEELLITVLEGGE